MSIKEKCGYCGADNGLHQYETMRCPKHGREAPVGEKQLWDEKTFIDADYLKLINEAPATAKERDRLKALNAEMLAWLKEEYVLCAPLSGRGRKLATLIAKAEAEQEGGK
jgi:hypothetical protein